MREIRRAFLRRRRVAVGRLVHPQPVRLEVRRHRHLRHRQLPVAPQRRDDLGGQEVRVDDDVPLVALDQVAKFAQVQLLHRQPQPVAARLGPPRLVHHVIEVAQDVRRFVNEVEVGLPVHLAERRVGQRQHVDIPHLRPRRQLPQRQLHRLRRAHVPRADGSGEDEDAGGSV